MIGNGRNAIPGETEKHGAAADKGGLRNKESVQQKAIPTLEVADHIAELLLAEEQVNVTERSP